MNLNKLGKRGSGYTSPTPPLGDFSAEKKDKQARGTFSKKGEQFPDSQDLMGGPKYKQVDLMTPSEKTFYAKEKLKQVAMKSAGRYGTDIDL